MKDPDLNIYRYLNGFGLSWSFSAKLALVVFAGVQAGAALFFLLYILYWPEVDRHMPLVTTLTFGMSLVASLLVYWLVSRLLAPLALVRKTFQHFLRTQSLPAPLPQHYQDELGELMAVAWHLLATTQEQQRQLREQAFHDGLTQLYNHRAANEMLSRELARASREGTPLCLVLIDLDDFKGINDRYGHSAGDACLRHLAGAIQKNIRQGDWCARWGGDEFLLVLHGPISAAHACTSRIRDFLKGQLTPLSANQHVQLQLSFGACSFAGEDKAEQLFDRADQALLMAKAQGKNRLYVCNYSHRSSAPDEAVCIKVS